MSNWPPKLLYQSILPPQLVRMPNSCLPSLTWGTIKLLHLCSMSHSCSQHAGRENRASICENFKNKCHVHSTLVIFIFMILLVFYGMYKSRGWELRSERWKMGQNRMGSGFSWHWLKVSSIDSWVASTVSLCHKLIAAAAAKSLQSCPTLCDPIDGSPPGSLIPGILQARTLEWVAISFST